MANSEPIQKRYEKWLSNLKSIVLGNDYIHEDAANALLSSLSELSDNRSKELAEARLAEFESIRNTSSDERTRQNIQTLVSDLLLVYDNDKKRLSDFSAPRHMSRFMDMQRRLLGRAERPAGDAPPSSTDNSSCASTDGVSPADAVTVGSVAGEAMSGGARMDTVEVVPTLASGLTIDTGDGNMSPEESPWKDLANISELADIVVNVGKASARDKALINNWTYRESRRATLLRQDILRNETRRDMLDEQPQGMWSEQMSKLDASIAESTAAFQEAESAVQLARAALEAAEKQKREVEQQLNRAQSVSQEAQRKKAMVKSVTDLALDINRTNQQQVESELAALNGLKQTYAALTDSLFAQQIEKELPELFHFLMNAIRTNTGVIGTPRGVEFPTAAEELSSVTADGDTPRADPADIVNGGEQDKVSKDMLLRIGLEVIRLWRQLNRCTQGVTDCLNAFESALSGDLAVARAAPPSDGIPFTADGKTRKISSAVYTDSTAFLYFNHVFHDTPDGHIESQMRVESVVNRVSRRMIRETIASENARLKSEASATASEKPCDDSAPDAIAAQGAEGSAMTEDTSSARSVESDPSFPPGRKLVVLPCLGLLAPPEWTLPLVHAPAYIRKLRDLATEAKKEDLLIPLEFDSDEYEDLNVMEEELENMSGGTAAEDISVEKLRSMEPREFVHEALRLCPADNKVVGIYKKCRNLSEDSESDTESGHFAIPTSGKRRRKRKSFADGTSAAIAHGSSRRDRRDSAVTFSDTSDRNESDSGNGSGSHDDENNLPVNDISDLGPADESKLVKIIYTILSIVGSKKRIYTTCDIGVNNFNHWLKRREKKPKISRRDGSGMWIQVGPILKRRIEDKLSLHEIESLLSDGASVSEEVKRKVMVAFGCEQSETVSVIDESGSEEEEVMANDPSDLGPINERKLLRCIEKILSIVGTKKSIYTTCRLDPNQFSMWMRRRRMSPKPNPARDGAGVWATEIGPYLKLFLENNLTLDEIDMLNKHIAVPSELETKILKLFNALRETSGDDHSEGDVTGTNDPSDLGPADESKLYRLVNKLIHITGAKRRIYDTLGLNPNHFASWLKQRKDYPIPSTRRDGHSVWVPLVGPSLKKFIEENLTLDEIKDVLNTNSSYSNLDSTLKSKICKIFNAYISESSDGSSSDMSVDDVEDSRENDETDLGPADESKMLQLMYKLISITGTKKSIYDTCKINPNYFNQWIRTRESDPKPSRRDGGGAWISVGATVKKLVLELLSVDEVHALLNETPATEDQNDLIRQKVLKLFGVNYDSTMLQDEDSSGDERSGSGSKNDPSELGPADETKLLRLIRIIMAMTGTKKSIYDTCDINPNNFSLWLSRRKTNPVCFRRRDGTGSWVSVGGTLKKFIETHFDHDEIEDILLTGPGDCSRELELKVLGIFSHKYRKAMRHTDNDTDASDDFRPRAPKHSTVNDPSDLGPANESTLLTVVNKLVSIVGSKKRIYVTCNIGVNHFNLWMKNREAAPEPSAADGRGQWTDVGPTIKKYLEKHLTLPELMTIVNWDNHYIPGSGQRADPSDNRLEAKLHSMFYREGRRSLPDEDDYNEERLVELNPILGDERDETNLLKIVNNTIDLVGTKKAIYGNCDIGANHFSRWVKNRTESPIPSVHDGTGQWAEAGGQLRKFFSRQFKSEELRELAVSSVVSPAVRAKVQAVFTDSYESEEDSFRGRSGDRSRRRRTLNSTKDWDSSGDSDDASESSLSDDDKDAAQRRGASSLVNTAADLGPADETKLVQVFDKLAGFVTKKKICATCNIQTRYLYQWEVKRRKELKPHAGEGRGRWTKIGPILRNWLESKLDIPDIQFLMTTTNGHDSNVARLLSKLFGDDPTITPALQPAVAVPDTANAPLDFYVRDLVNTKYGEGTITESSPTDISVKIPSGLTFHGTPSDVTMKQSFGALVFSVMDRIFSLVSTHKRISEELDVAPPSLAAWIKSKRKAPSVPSVHSNVEKAVIAWLDKLDRKELELIGHNGSPNLQELIPLFCKLFGDKCIPWTQEWKDMLSIGDSVSTKYGQGKVVDFPTASPGSVSVKFCDWSGVGHLSRQDVEVMSLAVLDSRAVIQTGKVKTGDKYLNKFIEAQIAMYPNKPDGATSTPHKVEVEASDVPSITTESPYDATKFSDLIDIQTNSVFCRLVCDTLEHKNIKKVELTRFLQKCGFDIKGGQISCWKYGSLSKGNRHTMVPVLLGWLLTEKEDLTPNQVGELTETIQLASQHIDGFRGAIDSAFKVIADQLTGESGSDEEKAGSEHNQTCRGTGATLKRPREDIEDEASLGDSSLSSKRFKSKTPEADTEFVRPPNAYENSPEAFNLDPKSVLADDYVLVNMVDKLVDMAGSQKNLYEKFKLRMSHFQQWLKIKRMDPTRGSKTGQWIQIGYLIRQIVEARLSQVEISEILQLDARSQAPERLVRKLFGEPSQRRKSFGRSQKYDNSAADLVTASGDTVSTSFGEGTVVADSESVYDTIPVKFPWGAVGYFNSGDVTVKQRSMDIMNGPALLEIVDSLIGLVGTQKRICDEFNTPATSFSSYLKSLRATPNQAISKSTTGSTLLGWLSVLSSSDKKRLVDAGANASGTLDVVPVLEKLFGQKSAVWLAERAASNSVIKNEPQVGATQSEVEVESDGRSVVDEERSPHEMPCKSSEILRADKMIPGTHSTFCEACKKPGSTGALVYCGSCPCAFHPRCAEYSTQNRDPDDMSTETWYCARCYELGANENNVVTSEEKGDYSLCQKWILLFFKNSRRWSPAFVLGKNHKHNAFLCEYWKGRKHQRAKINQWLDISSCRVLKPSEVCISTPGFGNDFTVSLKGRKRTPRLKKSNASTKKIESGMGGSADAEVVHDTYISADSFDAALCAAGVATRAVDIVVHSENTNAFACVRPPGHHAGRYGFTKGCLSTGFCLLNNAAISMVYARVKYGMRKVAVVDIDVHFGNGTAELLKGDPNAFFACVHMIHGEGNKGFDKHEGHHGRQRGRGIVDDSAEDFEAGFFPNDIGGTELNGENFFSIGVYPAETTLPFGSTTGNSAKIRRDNNGARADPEFGHDLFGPTGFRRAFSELVIPQLKKFNPELLIISAGFDGFHTDPVGRNLGLTQSDYTWVTNELLAAMENCSGRVVSLLEGGYDVNPGTLGLATCVDTHVSALQRG